MKPNQFADAASFLPGSAARPSAAPQLCPPPARRPRPFLQLSPNAPAQRPAASFGRRQPTAHERQRARFPPRSPENTGRSETFGPQIAPAIAAVCFDLLSRSQHPRRLLEKQDGNGTRTGHRSTEVRIISSIAPVAL